MVGKEGWVFEAESLSPGSFILSTSQSAKTEEAGPHTPTARSFPSPQLNSLRHYRPNRPFSLSVVPVRNVNVTAVQDPSTTEPRLTLLLVLSTNGDRKEAAQVLTSSFN